MTIQARYDAARLRLHAATTNLPSGQERELEVLKVVNELETIIDELIAEKDRQAWSEDEKDMQRIKREWDAFDRDPPGS